MLEVLCQCGEGARRVVVLVVTLVVVTSCCSATTVNGSLRHPELSQDILARYPGQDDYISPSRAVVVGEGGVADLPCNMTSPLPADPTLLVLWYKHGVTKPIYSYDLREGLPFHWRNPHHLGTRAAFHASIHASAHSQAEETPSLTSAHANPRASFLRIQGVLARDRGTYKCRVDFRVNPTLTFTTNLTVMVPPRRLAVYTDDGVLVRRVVGPYREGDTLRLICRASGGLPPPRVTWWEGPDLLDLTSEIQKVGEVRSMLMVPALTRGDLRRVFTCRAANSNLTEPLLTDVSLDMHLPPLWVRLLSSREALSAGWPYNVVCQAAGARPLAVFTWYLRNITLTTHTEQRSDGDNVTTSELLWTPRPEDDSEVLRCEAASPALPFHTLQDNWTLQVYYVPVVTLEPGRSVDLSDIKEGDDVYFECSITSNPWVYNMVWLHEGEELRHNVSAGVIISNQSLVLQRVDKTASGNYYCVASNIEGDGHSNPLRLRVKYRPVCRSPKVVYHGAARFELVNLPCHLDAYPTPLSFRWTFNTSGESVEIPQEHIMVAGSRSTVSYAPNTEFDYGTLMCWGVNSVGLQRHPCVFHVFPADHPDPVHNCSVRNVTTRGVSVYCVAGFDGGLPQNFVLELYASGHDHLLVNITTAVPAFTVDGLAAGTTVEGVVYSYNSKGRSEEVPVSATIMRDLPEKRTAAVKPSPALEEEEEEEEEEAKSLAAESLTELVVGAAGVLILVPFVVYVVVRRGREAIRKHNSRRGGVAGGQKDLAVCLTQVSDNRLEEPPAHTPHEDDPDVIPQSAGDQQLCGSTQLPPPTDSTSLHGRRVTTISSACPLTTYDALPGYQPSGGEDMQHAALLQRGPPTTSTTTTTTSKLERLDPQRHTAPPHHTHARLYYPATSHADTRNVHRTKGPHRRRQQELHQQQVSWTPSVAATAREYAPWTSTSATAGQDYSPRTPTSAATAGQEYAPWTSTTAATGQHHLLRRDHHLRDPEPTVALVTKQESSV